MELVTVIQFLGPDIVASILGMINSLAGLVGITISRAVQFYRTDLGFATSPSVTRYLIWRENDYSDSFAYMRRGLFALFVIGSILFGVLWRVAIAWAI